MAETKQTGLADGTINITSATEGKEQQHALLRDKEFMFLNRSGRRDHCIE